MMLRLTILALRMARAGRPLVLAAALAVAAAPTLAASTPGTPGTPGATGAGVVWRSAAADADIEQAFDQARAEAKPVLLYWGA